MGSPPHTGPYYIMDLLVRKWKRVLPLAVQDILYEQQQQRRQSTSDGDNDKNNNSRNNLSVPALSKNGRWIQALYVDQRLLLIPYRPQPYQVITMPPGHSAITNTAADTVSALQRHSHRHNHNPKLTTTEVLLHLFKRCPNLQTLQIHGQDKLAAEYYFWKTVMTHGISDTLRELHIILDAGIRLPKLTILKILLARCPLGLRKLTLESEYCGGSKREQSPDVDTKGDVIMAPLPALTDLRVEFFRYSSLPSCIRFLGRCVNLESLFLKQCDGEWIRALRFCDRLKRLTVFTMNEYALLDFASAFTSGLPLSLNTFHVLVKTEFGSDQAVSSVIRACRSG
ncbi:MAG: hypothetical protein JOS17DRAFT_842146 [Linnemannia elongata]|nr:MAG: hypothetical protein JOS17DRAFT_842146 [Linnemannia elongata]